MMLRYLPLLIAGLMLGGCCLSGNCYAPVANSAPAAGPTGVATTSAPDGLGPALADDEPQARAFAVARLARGDHGAGLDGRIHHKPPASLGNASATRIRNLIATRTFIGPDSVSMPLRGSIGHGWNAASSLALTVDHAPACPWSFNQNA